MSSGFDRVESGNIAVLSGIGCPVRRDWNGCNGGRSCVDTAASSWMDSPCNYESQDILILCHIIDVEWSVELAVEFEGEFEDLPEEVQTELAAQARLLRTFGPQLGRPRADTLNGSKFANMKELRF